MKNLISIKRQANLLRFKPQGDAIKPPHNMPLWHDINVFFVTLFNQSDRPDSILIMNADELICFLESMFGGTYNLQDVQKMLDIEYKKKPGAYSHAFLRDDFLKEVEK